ncbi:hypothetical protein E2C01_024563 [Portunus trituberculatus]|uniref:Uncharacterized protein n=1 Tax=Portunus trituberculatus TaxID=210409 RepID=A0A5B7ECN9_PORTR|nr:hypothetical protein [Portunus trituberculatus]
MQSRDEIWDELSLNCQVKYLLASRSSALVSESNVVGGETGSCIAHSSYLTPHASRLTPHTSRPDTMLVFFFPKAL